MCIRDSDNDVNDLTLTITSGPSWLTVSGLTLGGTPGNTDVGTNTVLLNVSDGDAIVPISYDLTVNNVNDPPVAQDQSVTLNEDETVTIYAHGNDEDSEGLTFTITDSPDHGSLNIRREFATYIYTPNANYNGIDAFSFNVSDGEFSSDGTISLTINAVNDAPIAENGSAILDENTSVELTYSISDVDGDDLTVESVSAPLNGSVENNIYTPNPVSYTQLTLPTTPYV